MAALCEHFKMTPPDVWALNGEEYDALARRMDATVEAAEAHAGG
jgi:hypothetical protein